jgi:hypothetical protein
MERRLQRTRIHNDFSAFLKRVFQSSFRIHCFSSNHYSSSNLNDFRFRFATLMFMFSFAQTPVCAQQKEQATSKNIKGKEGQKSNLNSEQSFGFKKQTSLQTETVRTSNNLSKADGPITPIEQNKNSEKYTAPSNFDINGVSADVFEQLGENKKNNRPFFEGILLALEFELMDTKISESELDTRIQKSSNVKTPIQIKKKDKNLYWIITDTTISIAQIKEMVSSAGLTVNFISKSYLLK